MTLLENASFNSITTILSKFNESNINIGPDMLQLLKKSKISDVDLEDLIRKVSFSPKFNSHLTLNLFLLEFKDEFKFLSELIPEYNKKHTSKELKKRDLKKKKVEDKIPSKKEEIKLKVEINGEMALDEKNIHQDIHPNQPPSSSIRKIEIKGDSPLIQDKSSIETEKVDISNENTENSKGRLDEEKLNQLRIEKRKNWEKLKFQQRRSTSNFRAKASDYDARIEILKDPTGKMYTEGKIHEFVEIQVDKFNKLKKILSNRPEGSGLLDINMINRLENSVEVKFVGMVIEKRQTSKKNYLVEFEDPTGVCMTIVQQKSHQAYTVMNNLLPDHVVIVDGYLSVNTKENSRIILINSIIFPDSPFHHKPNCPDEDLSICFISDTHFGSKDWLQKEWDRFIEYLNCNIGNDKQIEEAGKIKYLCIAGDIVDGIGIYPNQDKRLFLTDIYKQYEEAAEQLAKLPEYIKIIASPGDHDSVRKAIPNPAIPKDFARNMYQNGIKMVGCPSRVELHGVSVEMFHGTSLIDMNMSIPGMTHEDPCKTMIELLKARDLSPTYGKKTEIAPLEKDWMILDTLPDILHTGHLHKNGVGFYHEILTINSGCFQAQTEFMKSLGIVPDYGKPTIVNIKNKLTARVIDLAGDF